MALPQQSTLLSCTNTVLRAINEAPVNSLTPPYTDTVGMALSTIDEIILELLSHGWSFNTESDVTLTLDVNGKYAIPPDVLQVTPDCPRSNLDLVPRDDAGTLRLYNRAKGQHTFVLPAGLKVTIVSLVDFEAMPQPYRRYVEIRAARTFQARLQNGVATVFSQEEEVRAKKEMRGYETDLQRPSVFDNWSVARVVRRGYPKIEGGFGGNDW